MTLEDFRRILETNLSQFTVMLAIAQGDDPATRTIVDNGTGTFIETPLAEFLVTNCHVHKEFLAYRERDATTTLLMSGAEGTRFLNISEASVIGRDEEHDLLTLSIPRPYVHGQGKRFARQKSWPPRRPRTGMLAFLIGYPGQGRIQLNGEVGIAPLTLGLPVVSASDRHFVLHDERGDAARFSPEELPPLTRFGGISGSAVYIWDRSASTREDMSFLGGFAYQASVSETVLVTYAYHINADGTMS